MAIDVGIVNLVSPDLASFDLEFGKSRHNEG